MSPDTTARNRAGGDDCEEEVRSALGAYALGALDPEEIQSLEAHLATCSACAEDLARYESALVALGGSVAPVPPPPLIRERLLAVAEADAEEPRRSPRQEPTVLSKRRPQITGLQQWARTPVVLPRMAAVGMALVAALLVAAIIASGAILLRVQDERDAAQAGQQELAEYLRNGGSVTPLVSMQGEEPSTEGGGSLVVAPGQSGALLVVDGLAPSAANRSYRVWVARAGDRTRVDELRVGPDGTGWLTLATAEPLASYDAVGITVVNPNTSERQDLLTAPILGGVPR